MCALQAGILDDTAVETAALFAEQASVVLATAHAFTRAQATAVSAGEALTSRSVIDTSSCARWPRALVDRVEPAMAPPRAGQCR